MTEEEKLFYKKIGEMVVNAREVVGQALEEVFPEPARRNLAEFLGGLGKKIRQAKEAAEKMTDEEAEAYLKNSIRQCTKKEFESNFKGKDATRQGFKVWVTYAATRTIMSVVVCQQHKGMDEKLKGWIDEYVDEVYPLKGRFNYSPPEKHNFPNDKISKAVRSTTEQEYEAGEINAIEIKANPKKHIKQIESKITFNLDKLRELGYSNPTPFDYYVIYTVFAIQMAGNEATTINGIYRAMTGKGPEDRPPSDEMQDAIAESLIKGMSTVLAILPEGIRKAYKKDIKRAESIGALLPVEIGPAKVNGIETDNAVIYHGKSPLVYAAEIKGGQFATYDTALLNVPKYKVSKQNILVAPFLLWHIEDSRNGGVAKIINVDNLIEAMGYDGRRDHLAKHIEKCFEYWKAVKYIKTYSIEKDGRGKIIRVTYTLPRLTKAIAQG